VNKSIFKRSILISSFIILIFSTSPIASAQVLPKTTHNREECEKLLRANNWKETFQSKEITQIGRSNILGCAIKTGDINLWMIPFFITYLINFILAVAGLISVLFIVVGGYRYIIGSAQGKTDEGKNTIMYAIVGLIITLMAWVIVNIVQTAVT